MADQPSFGLSHIGQIAIRVHDIDRAVACYRDQLWMQFLFSFPGTAFFQCGAVRLMLSKPEKGEFDHPSSIIYFTVDDINAAYERLKARGVHFEDEPHLIANMEP
ncbi:MAG: glyoxalase [Chloroflexi bacterium]|nr:MAG: glyoxalase [Chloroflexota bacterium]